MLETGRGKLSPVRPYLKRKIISNRKGERVARLPRFGSKPNEKRNGRENRAVEMHREGWYSPERKKKRKEKEKRKKKESFPFADLSGSRDSPRCFAERGSSQLRCSQRPSRLDLSFGTGRLLLRKSKHKIHRCPRNPFFCLLLATATSSFTEENGSLFRHERTGAEFLLHGGATRA